MPRMQGLTTWSLGHSQRASRRDEVTSSSGTKIRLAYCYYNKESSQAQGSSSVVHHPAHKYIHLGPLHHPRGTWRALSESAIFLTKESQLPQWLSSKESACNQGDAGSIPGSGRFPWSRKQQPTSVALSGKSHGQRSLAGYSPRGHRVRHDLGTK